MAATVRAHRVPVRAAMTVTALGLVTLTGCSHSDGVRVSAPIPSSAIATSCATLIARLPDDLVIGGHRGTTRPASPYTAAFGSAAMSAPVTVRCGVPIPSHSPTAAVLVVGGIDWLVLPEGKDTQRFVSFEHELPVEVTVTLPNLPVNVLPPVSALLNELVPPR